MDNRNLSTLAKLARDSCLIGKPSYSHIFDQQSHLPDYCGTHNNFLKFRSIVATYTLKTRHPLNLLPSGLYSYIVGCISYVTDGIFSPVGEHADSRGHLTDSTSDSTGVSPAMTTRSIPGGLSLHDVYVSVDNGHSVAAGDIGGPPDGPNGRASGYCGTPDGQSGPPGVYTGTPGGYSGAAVNEVSYSVFVLLFTFLNCYLY